MFIVKKSSYDDLNRRYEIGFHKYTKLEDTFVKVETENMHLQAKITAYEKTYKIRTGPWKDSIGRWRDPKTGHCIKAPDPIVAEASEREVIKKLQAAADRNQKLRKKAAYAKLNIQV